MRPVLKNLGNLFRKYIFSAILFFLSAYFFILNEQLPFLKWMNSISFDINFYGETFEEIESQYVVGIGLFIGALIAAILKAKKEEVAKLNTEKETLKTQLKEETKAIYTKFSELLVHKDSQIISETMQSFVENNTFVIAAQTYKYVINFKRKNKFLISRKSNYYELILHNLDNAVVQGEDLNAIVSATYQIPADTFRQLDKALSSNDINLMGQFIDSKTEILRNRQLRTNRSLTTKDFMIYNALMICSETLMFKAGIRAYDTIENVPESIDVSIFKVPQRTGLLRSILYGHFSNKEARDEGKYYIFKYTPKADGVNSGKDGRIYLARAYAYNGESQLLLLVIDSSILDETEGWNQLYGIEAELTDMLDAKGIKLG